ncbi:TPA: hypothetical protein N0F65_002666 [Lagenidium giganteum]|uniref:DDE-1 domain-containing protein n=1 Tax=Lagenidium giganteum TaxID=4803 RepID=A0AAV2Z3V1_9STRA|nr:TPA: hypothetical protein N0F65_002666 [Lagenidium giganteum]
MHKTTCSRHRSLSRENWCRQEFLIPPLILKSCSTPSGFVSEEVFIQWLNVFACNVPDTVKRPLFLVCDGCSSPVGNPVAAAATRLEIRLLFLPPNAMHLLQPLDVAVSQLTKRQFVERFVASSTKMAVSARVMPCALVGELGKYARRHQYRVRI